MNLCLYVISMNDERGWMLLQLKDTEVLDTLCRHSEHNWTEYFLTFGSLSLHRSVGLSWEWMPTHMDVFYTFTPLNIWGSDRDTTCSCVCDRLIVMAMPKGQWDASSCYCGNVTMFWGSLNVNLIVKNLGKIIVILWTVNLFWIGFRYPMSLCASVLLLPC